MSTRSMIGRANEDGTITGIYCHYDGYVGGVGRKLAAHYADPAKVDALMALGDISSLGAEIGEKHDFRARPRGQCNAYGRDRGESDVDAGAFADRAAFAEEFGYAYLFDGGTWLVFARYAEPPLLWAPLEDVIAADDAAKAAEVSL